MRDHVGNFQMSHFRAREYSNFAEFLDVLSSGSLETWGDPAAPSHSPFSQSLVLSGPLFPPPGVPVTGISPLPE